MQSHIKDLVSVIMPTYNSSLFIEAALDSIISQSYSNLEVLITDDCSTDNTLEKVKEYAKRDSRIKVYQLDKNSGPGIARNNSINHAQGRYIAFCDSDDLWLGNKVEQQIKFMNLNNLAFTFSSYQKINGKGEMRGIIKAPDQLHYKDLLRSCPIGCLTAIYDTEKIGKVYMPEIKKRQDYGLWLRIFKSIQKTKGMPEVLAHYRERNNSVSSNKLLAAIYHYRVLKQEGKVSSIKAMYFFFHYAFSGLSKYLR